jgi:hypothetical protein
VKKALESNDPKAINRTLDALMQAQQKAAEALYKNAAPPESGGEAPGGGRSSGPGHADDVIDAEIVDEKK